MKIIRLSSLILIFLINSNIVFGASQHDKHTNQPVIKHLSQRVETKGIVGGLIVHAGCGDSKMTADLRINDNFIVQGLDTKTDNIKRARDHIQSLGLYGEVTVDTFDGKSLPYIDNVVNVLVVNQPYQLSKSEMIRVLAPGGIAFIQNDGTWQEIQKPWPDNIDEWTHYLHGPDNNAVANDTQVGPPRHMQWLAGPRWTRSHHKLNSISAMVTSQGRLYYIVDESPASNINIPSEWSIIARDAFNGIQLWKKPLPSWSWHKIRFRSGPPQVTRLFVASEGRLYVPLGLNAPVSELDAASGKTLQTFEETKGAEEIILNNGVLIVLKGAPVAEQAKQHPDFKDQFRFPNQKTVFAINLDTGQPMWTWNNPKANPLPETLASDGENVYFQVNETVVCVDLQSGDERWIFGEQDKRISRNKLNFGEYTLVVKDGVILCKLAGKLKAISAKDGSFLWECDAGGGFHAPVDVFVIDGLVWQGMHVGDSISPPPVHDFNVGRDLHTGEVKTENKVMVDLQTPGHHHRCYREKATSRFILAGKRGIEFMDLIGENHSRNNWVRGTCQYGVLPANGLIYAPPHACGCYMESKLWGFWSLAANQSHWERIPDEQRLLEGPAYGKTIKTSDDGEDAWPQYRSDAIRSGVAKATLQGKLKSEWKTNIGGSLTPPVAAEGKVIVSSQDSHTVYALDETSGSIVWNFPVGGNVNSPPTIFEGKVLFGSADGSVYCMRLNDGELIWRFLAAPVDRRTVVMNKVESVWPVHGSILVQNGIAYCSAGRSSYLDGGIEMYGLDPQTGEILFQTHVASQHPKWREVQNEKKEDSEYVVRIDQNLTDYKTFLATDRSDAFSMAGGVTSDVLVSNGKDVFLHHLGFNSELEPNDFLKRHLFSTSSLLDESESHRSHWVLGTGDFSRIPVAYSWIVNRPKIRPKTIAVPTGVMMVYDDQAVWGVRRKGDSNGQYQLFKKRNNPFSETEETLSDFRELPQDKVDPCLWKKDFPLRVRGMLKSGDHLFLSVMPADVPLKDELVSNDEIQGCGLWIISTEDGSKQDEYALPSPVVWDGMAAAGKRLFLSTHEGAIICFEES